MTEPPEHPNVHLSTQMCTQVLAHAPKHHHLAPMGPVAQPLGQGRGWEAPIRAPQMAELGFSRQRAASVTFPLRPALVNDGFHLPELNECGCLTACLQKGGALRRDLL